MLGLTLANPLEVYRIASIDLLRDSLELLGPSGLVAWGLRFAVGPILTALLSLWIVVPLAIAYLVMARGERRQ